MLPVPGPSAELAAAARRHRRIPAVAAYAALFRAGEWSTPAWRGAGPGYCSPYKPNFRLSPPQPGASAAAARAAAFATQCYSWLFFWNARDAECVLAGVWVVNPPGPERGSRGAVARSQFRAEPRVAGITVRLAEEGRPALSELLSAWQTQHFPMAYAGNPAIEGLPVLERGPPPLPGWLGNIFGGLGARNADNNPSNALAIVTSQQTASVGLPPPDSPFWQRRAFVSLLHEKKVQHSPPAGRRFHSAAECTWSRAR